jgi:type I restriction enzyme S subunit
LIRPGYKQTEVGVIPEDWRTITAGQVCELVVDCKNRTPPVVDGGEYAVVRTPNVRNGQFVRKELRFTDERSFGEWTARAIPKTGDILITREAPLGEVCLVPFDIQVCLGQRMMLYRPDRMEVDSRFLLHCLMSSGVQRNLLTKIGGSTVGHAKVNDIRDLQIPLPPTKAEQEAIAEALSDADALIESLEELIAKKRQIKQGAMQELLTGKTRLPGFSGKWEEKQLGDLGDITGAGVDKKVKPDENPIRLVNYMDAYRKDFICSEDLDHWVTAPSEKAQRCAVQMGDVFFTPSSETRDDIANSAVATEDIPDAAYSYHLVRLRFTEPWDLGFRAYAFKTREFLAQAETLCEGSGTRYVLSLGKFRSLLVKIPEPNEQMAIASILSDMDAEIAALETKLAKARQIKGGMMQELLTGRIRLINGELRMENGE